MARRPPKKNAGKSAVSNTSVRDDNGDGIKLRRDIGKRLRLTRKALYFLGMAPRWQKDFATSIGFPGSTYNQVEWGKQILTPAQAVRIYQRYGISLNWIYVGVEKDLPSQLVEAIQVERENSLRQLTSEKTATR